MSATTEVDAAFHSAPVEVFTRDGYVLLVDAVGPHWIATDAAGAQIVERALRGATPRDAAAYAGVALDDARAFVARGRAAGFFRDAPIVHPPEGRRDAALKLDRLTELWLHVDDRCNLACDHCLVSSGPDRDPGPDAAFWRRVVAEGRALGVGRFCVTGGEPFLRRDMEEILAAACANGGRAVVLTNGMPLTDRRLAALRAIGDVSLQMSLDGATAATNDALRGAGCFEGTTAAIRRARAAGFDVVVTTSLTARNVDEAPRLAPLLRELGVSTHHVLFAHRRGRGLDGGFALSGARARDALFAARDAGAREGVVVDNFVHLRNRLAGPKLLRYDLSNAGWDSLAVHADYGVYPSAAFAGHAPLRLGDARDEGGLARAWRESSVARELRSASTIDRPQCRTCVVRRQCGGGDVEHAYFHGEGGADRAAFLGDDPYCEAHKAAVFATFDDLVAEARRAAPDRSSPGPKLWRAMGDGAAPCAAGVPYAVLTTRSACVLPTPKRAP